VLRGGDWRDDANFCRTANRIGIFQSYAYGILFGFRSVLSSGQ
jgi:hypothetical protein